MHRNKLNEYLRTMLLDNSRIIADNDLNLDDFWTTMQLVRRSVSEESTFAEGMRLIIKPVEPGQIRLPLPRETHFIVKMESQMTHKVFFRMENGLFGITHQGVQTGDVLCVFQGARMPHLLRKQDTGSWTFVGEPYVSELMHGEAKEPVEGVSLETETFVLV